jgi:hypothetical protein
MRLQEDTLIDIVSFFHEGTFNNNNSNGNNNNNNDNDNDNNTSQALSSRGMESVLYKLYWCV